MLSFLLIDSISGFIRIYLGITNPLFNVGYWIRGPILVFFILYYLEKLYKNNLFYDELLSLILFLFFIFNTFVFYIQSPSLNMLIENFTYILRFQFLLFLYVFLKNRMTLTLTFTRKIISIILKMFNLKTKSYMLKNEKK